MNYTDYTDYATTGSNSLSNIITTVNGYNTNGIEIQLNPAGEVYINPQGDVYTYSTSVATSTYPIHSNHNGKVYKSKDTNKNSNELSPIDKKIKERIELNKKTGEKGGYYFTNVKEYIPNKVYGFIIKTNPSYFPYETDKEIKTICDESDIFSLEKAFFIALAKYKYQSTLTPEGIVKQAEIMQYNKSDVKTVQNGMKLFKLLQEKEVYDKEQERLKKIKHEKYVQKKKERKTKKGNDLQKIITEAIKNAK